MVGDARIYQDTRTSHGSWIILVHWRLGIDMFFNRPLLNRHLKGI